MLDRNGNGARSGLIAALVVSALSLTGVVRAGTSTPGAAASRVDDRARLIAEVKPMLALTAYRERSVITFRGKTTTRLLEFVAPDRIHVSGGVSPETISIGSKTWMRIPGAGWQPSPIGIGSMVRAMRTSSSFSQLANDENATYVDGGAGTWNGQPALIFRSTLRYGSLSAHSTIYIMRDHYIHHIDSTTSSGTTSEDYDEFNSRGISIQPPA